MLVHSLYMKRSMAGSSRDTTILEFMDEMSEASEDDIDVLFPTLAPPIPAIGEHQINK